MGTEEAAATAQPAPGSYVYFQERLSATNRFKRLSWVAQRTVAVVRAKVVSGNGSATLLHTEGNADSDLNGHEVELATDRLLRDPKSGALRTDECHPPRDFGRWRPG